MCKHKNIETTTDISYLEDANRFTADIRIRCADCGTPFRFIGLPAGLDLNGAAVSADGTEGRFAIAPKSEVLSMIEGAPVGFTVRKHNGM
jgi:hypothetical protein